MLDVPLARAVLPTKLDYFNDRNASEIIDGKFRVLGKVIRVVGDDSGEAINLLRKTVFGKLDHRVFDQLENIFVDQEEVGLKFPELFAEIEVPALQVIPIAIFA